MSPSRTFVANCRQVIHNAGDPPYLTRLLRLAERAVELEEVLRADDPGHDVTAAVCTPTQDRTKAVWNFSRMGRALLATVGPFERGVCRVCGCTWITACEVRTEEGSRACGWWAGTDETLCDRPECLAAAIASGTLTPPECFVPPPEIAKYLPGGNGTR